MPIALRVSDYDILTLPKGHTSASRALRGIDVPVTAQSLDVQLAPTGGRGIAMHYEGSPDPVSGRGGCQDDYCGDELGIVSSVFSLYVMSVSGGQGNPNPPSIIFEILSGAGNTVTVRGTWALGMNSFHYRDFLVEVSGLRGTQFEIRTRIDPTDQNAQTGVRIFLAATLSLPDDAQSRTTIGPNVAVSPP